MVSKENIATIDGKDLPVSTKHAIEICNFIRGKTLLKSKAFLKKVIAKKEALPFKRYKGDVGHKPGKTGPGRYPLNACQTILRLLESLEINAQNKGLDTAALYLKEVIPNKASNVWRYGRWRRRRRKLTHIFMLTEEAVKKKREKPKEEKKVKETKEEGSKEKKEEPKKIEKREAKSEVKK
ncbi:MAG: 50S ribosomal protein L22 [Nanoarchaeota archaeon]|nr:50S ribosomal protein L22 [Nanoarchaeota archaeon]